MRARAACIGGAWLTLTMATFWPARVEPGSIATSGGAGPGVRAPAARAAAFAPIYDVSSDGSDARNPSVVLAPDGVLFVTWGRVGARVDGSVSFDGGATFSRPRPVSIPGGEPAMVVTHAGTLVVAAASNDSMSCARSFDGGLSFLPGPFTVQRLTGSGRAALASDSVSRTSLVWDIDSLTVYYAQSTNDGQSFLAPIAISADKGAGFLQWRPVVSVDMLRKIYVAWNHAHTPAPGENWIMFSSSVKNIGIQFSVPTPLSDTLRSAVDAQVLATGSGVVDVAWIYTGVPDSVCVVESTNSGTSFGRRAAVALPGDGGGTSRSLTAIRALDGTIHMVLEVSVGGNRECYYLSLPALSSIFNPPVNLSNTPGASLAPAVAVDGTGVPVIAWSDVLGRGRDIVFTRRLP